MEKVIFLFCVFSWTMQTTSSGSSDLLRVQMGESISLNCSMRNRYEIAWYHLKSEQLDLLITAEKDKTGRSLLINYNPYVTRMKMTADRWITRATIVISGVTESDAGLYFCGTKSDAPEMLFNKPIRLQIEGLIVVQETKEETDNTDGVTLTERVLIFGGFGLALFVGFLATVIAGGIIYYRGWQKGWAAAKRSSRIHHKSAK